MYEKLIDNLRCPSDMGLLSIEDFTKDDDGHIMAGNLMCERCGSIYPIVDGVPDMFPVDTVSVDGEDMKKLQAETVNKFGFEWQYFRDWGWLTQYPDVPNAEAKFMGGLLKNTKNAFWNKSLFEKEDLKSGVLVLDAGCGNGRFTKEAAKTGAEIIGIDLGWGVYSAFSHMRSLNNVHIVRGDLFRLPFDDKTFDRVFSIGVLMHTGNAKEAFNSIIRKLNDGGIVVAHVYGRGRLSYEKIDKLIRSVTTRLPIKIQMLFAKVTASMTRWLKAGDEKRTRFYWRLFSHINLLPTEHHMFDWWSAPIATHHEMGEVLDWFSGNNLKVIRTNPTMNDDNAERKRLRYHGSITVLGKK